MTNKLGCFFPRAMSENGGILTNGFTEEEMETKAKDLLVLQRKPGFCKDDDTATFGSVQAEGGSIL